MADFCTCDEFAMDDREDSFGFISTDAPFPIPVDLGGTGADNVLGAQKNLGLLTNKNSVTLWAVGAINSTSGANSTSTTRLRTSAYIGKGVKQLIVESGYRYLVFAYDSSGTYVGIWNGSTFVKSVNWRTVDTDLTALPDYNYRIVLARDPDSGAMTTDLALNLVMLASTDASLTISGEAADAGAVNERAILYRRQLLSTDLLDDITENGTYAAVQSAIVADAPTGYPFAMLLFGNISNRKAEIIVNRVGSLYVRFRYGSEWGTWEEYAKRTYVDKAADELRAAIERVGDYERITPENIGVANVIRRAYQLVKLSYVPLNPIPNFGTRIIPKDVEFEGVPYSSPRPENLFVPNAVSIETYMTAAKNPNSYLYKRRLNIPGYSGHCYYGSVCSAFAAWCYGIDDTLPTTVSFATYPGFTELPAAQQNYENVKLGDLLNKPDVHLVIVTDLWRNRFGELAFVELSEEINTGNAKSISTIYSIDKITQLIGSGYKIYRFDNIAGVQYSPSAFVHVDASETTEPVYNDVIIPRRGDKANWHYGEDVVIDVFDDSFTGYELENTLTSTTTTGTISGAVITLQNLAAGNYRLRATGSTNSEYVYFNVISTVGTRYEVQSGRTVKVTPTISRGTPASVAFCCNNPARGADNLAIRSFHVFTAQELANGYATVTAPAASSTIAPDDKWLLRCMYKTEFGLYSGQLTEVPVASTGSTVTEVGYVRSAYIEDYNNG